MSSEQLRKLQNAYTLEEKLGMLYTWTRQGVVRSKDFKEIVNSQIERKAKHMARLQLEDEELEDEYESPEEGSEYF